MKNRKGIKLQPRFMVAMILALFMVFSVMPLSVLADTLEAPQNVAANAESSSSIRIAWDMVGGADSYKIYRSESSTGPFTEVIQVYGTSHMDSGLASDTTYYYFVVAVDIMGSGAQSNIVSAKTLSAVPAAPSVYAQAIGAESIEVSWSAVSTATSYKVYRSLSHDGTYMHVGTLNSTMMTDTGLTPGTTYYYKVSALNGAGEGPQGGPADATTHIPLTAPINVAAVGLDTSRIQVSWNAVQGATGYYVYRSATANGTYSPIANVSTTNYINTGLQADTGYYYKVMAYNSNMQSELSNYAYAKTMAALAAPVITATAQSYSSIVVSWDAVQNAQSYLVYRSTSPTTGYALIGTVYQAGFPDTGLMPETTYYYKVVAKDSFGTAESNIANAKTLGLSAPIVTPQATSTSSIEVSWTAVNGAIEYDVYRDSTFVSAVTSTTYIDTGLMPSTQYEYTIVPKLGTYKGPGGTGNATTWSLLEKPMVTAVATSSSAIDVKWDAIDTADRYELRRKGPGESSFTVIAIIGTNNSATYTHIDSGLADDTTYAYEVRALRDADGLEGPWSDTAQATTWKLTFIVTFNLLGGTMNSPASVSVVKGDAVTAPADTPKRLGYVFAGWYADAEGNTANNFADGIYANTTIYAKWDKLYTVTFDYADGRAQTTASYLAGRQITVPQTPTRTGYTFVRWTYEGVAWNFENDRMPARDITLRAVWRENVVEPSPTPSVSPSPSPSVSEVPSESPSESPSEFPSVSPSEMPSPSVLPTPSPSTPPEGNVVEPALSVQDQEKIENQTGNIFTDLAQGNVPLGNLRIEAYWSLISLMLTLFGVINILVVSIRALARRKGNNEAFKKITLYGILSIIAGVLTGILFLLLDNMGHAFVFVNKWTLFVGIAFIASAVLLVMELVKNRRKNGLHQV